MKSGRRFERGDSQRHQFQGTVKLVLQPTLVLHKAGMKDGPIPVYTCD